MLAQYNNLLASLQAVRQKLTEHAAIVKHPVHDQAS